MVAVYMRYAHSVGFFYNDRQWKFYKHSTVGCHFCRVFTSLPQRVQYCLLLQMQEEKLHLCSATLSNHTETPLEFRLVCAEPFQLVELDPNSSTPRSQLLQTDFIALHPRQNALVRGMSYLSGT